MPSLLPSHPCGSDWSTGYPSVGATTVKAAEAVLSSGAYSQPETRGFTLVIANVTDAPLNDPTVNCAVPLPPVVTTLCPTVLPLHVTTTEARSEPSTVAPSEITNSTSQPSSPLDAFPEKPSMKSAVTLAMVVVVVVVDGGGVDVVVVVGGGEMVVVDGGGIDVVVVVVVGGGEMVVVVEAVVTEVVDDGSGIEVEVEFVSI
jgi:hypothetical protein